VIFSSDFFFLTYNSLHYIFSRFPKKFLSSIIISSEWRYKKSRWNEAKYVTSPPLLNALGERLANGLQEACDKDALKEVRPFVERRG
jgi:hypothetical protein